MPFSRRPLNSLLATLIISASFAAPAFAEDAKTENATEQAAKAAVEKAEEKSGKTNGKSNVNAVAPKGKMTHDEDGDAVETAQKKMRESISAAMNKDYDVIRFKGGVIKKSELDRLWKAMFPTPDAPKFESFEPNVQAEILKNVAREHLVLNKAYAANVDTTEDVKKQMETVKRQIVIQAYFKSIMDTLVPESEVRKEYEVLVEKFVGKEEIRARHILLTTEEEAKEVSKQLKGGADFAKLAKEKSADTGSGAQGGDLGYFTKERMVPEFSAAAFKLDKGEISDPVKSDFGWHVIQVEDKRPVTPPPFKDVKEKLQEKMANTAIEGYVRNLLKTQEVKLYAPDGKELPMREEAEEGKEPAAKPAAHDKKTDKK